MSLKVLIVDDEPLARARLRTLLGLPSVTSTSGFTSSIWRCWTSTCLVPTV